MSGLPGSRQRGDEWPAADVKIWRDTPAADPVMATVAAAIDTLGQTCRIRRNSSGRKES
jgi:hypothetical protein